MLLARAGVSVPALALSAWMGVWAGCSSVGPDIVPQTESPLVSHHHFIQRLVEYLSYRQPCTENKPSRNPAIFLLQFVNSLL